ncbi:MAG TPA: hypothetical protein ACFYD2_11115 [Candidatus Avalokitesvara rifleensis]|uniref:hypothetical protein n=1 Tax=Candidatus Avalokitesvara rifleensis TaxID=3367620 RepID=UPI004029C956
MRHSENGFTPIDIVVILAVFGVLLGTMIPLNIQILQKKRELQTVDELDKLSTAVTGNPVIVLNEARTQFGYVGDMGNLPSSLEDLYKKGSQPSHSFNTSKKIGAGWNGPYISPEIVEHLETLDADAFGNDYEYTTTAFTDSSTGAPALGRALSKGKDGTSGTSDDLSLTFFDSQVRSLVFGLIKDDVGDGVGGVVVTMNYPSNGVLTSTNTTTDGTGFYTFDNIPYGNRSVTLEPKLVLAAGSERVKGTANNQIEFNVTNFSASNISITKFKAVYSTDPPAYYETLKVGTTTVYNSSTPRLASGDTVTFSAITVAAGTGVSDSIPIRIQAPVTEVADIPIGTLGRGASMTIEMLTFKDVQSGTANNVNMIGVPMEITINEGLSGESIIRFTPF